MLDQTIISRRRKRQTVSMLCLTLMSPVATAFVPPQSQTRRRPYLHTTHPSVVKELRSSVHSIHPTVAVSIDQPLIFRDTLALPTSGAAPSVDPRLTPAVWVKSLIALVSTNGTTIKVAAMTLCATVILSLLFTRSGMLGSGFKSIFATMTSPFQAVFDRIRGEKAPVGVPMYFDDAENEGWGVCTLKAKRRFGKTSYTRYDFDLPEQHWVLPLELGQQLTLCCLDNEENVVKGDFYIFQPDRKMKPGIFSLLAPSRISRESAELSDADNLARVLKKEIRVGDEIAIKPGRVKLDYKGQYFPVTDMVYVAFGLGILPVLEQVRTVLPKGSSSVKSVTVAWINEDTKEFDLISELLEKEYYRYSNKMAVSCIVDNLEDKQITDSVEMNEAVPDFRQGTMAVVAGPPTMTKKALEYLEERGYPTDTICVL